MSRVLALNPAYPTLPNTQRAAGMLARNWPLAAGIPVLMPSPPTVTQSAANAATAVAGSALRNSVVGAGGTADIVTNLVRYSGAPLAASNYNVYGAWLQEDATWFSVSFVTDSPKFEILLIGNLQGYRLSVNNQLVTAQVGAGNPFVAGATIPADSQVYRVLMDFSGVRAFRTITMESGILGGSRMKFNGIQCLPIDTVLPAPRRGPKVICMDNSIGESTGATDSTTGVTQILSQLTGWDIQSCAYGGTGYANPNVSPARSAATGHLTDLLALPNVDLVLWLLGINDYNNQTPAATQAAATTCYAYVKANLPNVPQIVIGPLAGTGNVYLNANWIACRNAISAAAAAAGLPFADPVGLPYLLGTGRVGNLINDGNADLLVSNDSTHPSQAGHTAMAWVLASTISAAIGG